MKIKERGPGFTVMVRDNKTMASKSFTAYDDAMVLMSLFNKVQAAVRNFS